MWWRRTLLLLGTLLLTATLGLGWLGSQLYSAEPLVAEPATAAPLQVQRARTAATRTARILNRADTATDIHLEADELTALPSLLVRAYPRLFTDISLQPGRLQLAVSVRLESRWIPGYLSGRVTIPAGTALRLQKLTLGQLELPDALSNALLPALLDRLLGAESRRALLQGVQVKDVTTDQLDLHIKPPEAPGQHLGRLLERLRGWSGDSTPLDPEQVSAYYRFLIAQAETLDRRQWISLTYFIAPLMRQVDSQAATGEEHLQGRAALMALAIYLGDRRFQDLIGPVLDDDLSRITPHHRTLLAGRADLRLHFVYAMALQVLAAEGISHALGELKELLDSRYGGSGFSFADLAADRAGTLFALHATSTPDQARQLLDQFDQPLRERDLIMPTDRLPEGLSEAQFRQRYRHIDSPAYLALVTDIDTQLQALRLYREQNQPE